MSPMVASRTCILVRRPKLRIVGKPVTGFANAPRTSRKIRVPVVP